MCDVHHVARLVYYHALSFSEVWSSHLAEGARGNCLFPQASSQASSQASRETAITHLLLLYDTATSLNAAKIMSSRHSERPVLRVQYHAMSDWPL